MKCPDCHGTGKITCKYCEGSGFVSELNLAYIAILGFPMPEGHICNDCFGCGKIKCNHCNGTGEIPD